MPADGSTRKRRQKAAIACDFCRRRKLGCNSEIPCNKCSQYGRDCVYSERPAKERPTNSRIADLAQQNAELRASLSALQAPLTPESTIDNVARHDQANGESLRHTAFHGPSSALFDRQRPGHAQRPPSVSTDQEKDHLLARAATQRQLESIHAESGMLAFGDVDTELGMRLLAAFWNRQHYTGTVVYRPAFMRDMACQGPHFTPLLLNAMFFIASKHSPHTLSLDQDSDFCEGGMVFRRTVEKILYNKETQVLCKSRVTTIQTLLLLSDALFSWCDERSLSWHYLGIAINMIVDLVADKVQSIYQGRQCRLRSADNNVPISFLDEYEELEPFNTVTFAAEPAQTRTPTRGVTTFEQTANLSVIAESIMSTLYSERASSTGIEELLGDAQVVNTELQAWKDALPLHLRLDWGEIRPFNILPHTLALMLMYDSLSILLHRPFVSGGHIQGMAGPSAGSAFSECTRAASEIDKTLRLYVEHFCVKSCPYFLSYATYVSATIHVRLAAQHAPGSKSHQSLRFCLEVLSEQQKRCHAPRRSMAILLELMKRMNVDVGKTFTAAKSRSEDMERCQLDPLVDSTDQNAFLENMDSWMNTSTAFDDISSDFDLDAIMKTFDFTAQGFSASEEGASSAQDPNDGGAGSTSWSYDTSDGPSSNACYGLTLDPLFGLDVPMFDTNFF